MAGNVCKESPLNSWTEHALEICCPTGSLHQATSAHLVILPVQVCSLLCVDVPQMLFLAPCLVSFHPRLLPLWLPFLIATLDYGYINSWPSVLTS